MRSDERYMFSSVRSVANKLIVPFDLTDMRAGGRSIFVEQRGFAESLRATDPGRLIGPRRPHGTFSSLGRFTGIIFERTPP
jgi:hypothetical protein